MQGIAAQLKANSEGSKPWAKEVPATQGTTIKGNGQAARKPAALSAFEEQLEGMIPEIPTGLPGFCVELKPERTMNSQPRDTPADGPHITEIAKPENRPSRLELEIG